MEPHGLSRWRHGCSRITPVSPRRRPGGDTVAPGVFPVYHGIWQPSRLLPVSPGCFKHFKTTGDMSRFNTVQHGSSRISKVVHGAATVVTRFITVHPGSSNRGEPAPLTGTVRTGLKGCIHPVDKAFMLPNSFSLRQIRLTKLNLHA